MWVSSHSILFLVVVVSVAALWIPWWKSGVGGKEEYVKSMESMDRVSAHGVLGLTVGAGGNILLSTVVDVGLILPFVLCLRSASVMVPLCIYIPVH